MTHVTGGSGFYVTQYLKHSRETLLQVFGNECLHSLWRAGLGVTVKSFIITAAVGKLYVNGWIAGTDKLEVHQQTSGSTISVNEGVDTLKAQMEQRHFLNKMMLMIK